MPKISVVMSVYNGEKYLKRAIDSILNQTFTDFEFIIINDGSTDKSLDIIENYSDKRIVLINQENKGLTRSLNIGIKKAKGEYIARQDDDDVSLPLRLEKQILFLNRYKDIALLGTRVYEITNHKKIVGKYYGNNSINNLIIKQNTLTHSSTMFRTDVCIKIGLYNENLLTSQDFDLWIRFAKMGKIAMLEDILVEYYIHNDSITSKKRLKQCVNGYTIRKEHSSISFIENLKITSYQYISAYIPTFIVKIKRKFINNV